MANSPQKALHLYIEADKKKPKYIGEEYMVFEKHDGWYGYIDLPSCTIHSRAMRVIPALRDFCLEIQGKAPNVRGRLLFEIMIEGMEVDSFHTLNGILNRKHEQADDVYLRVHDFIPLKQNEMSAKTRYEFASEIVSRFSDSRVRTSPLLGVSSNPDEWQALAAKVWEKGGEGVILKRSNAPYSFEKRNADLMKIKEEVTLDLLVVDVIGGEGKYSHTLGALIVQGKNGIKHKISGMTDAERDDWWMKPNDIKGKVVEVKAMKVLKDGTLREPRYKAVRFDKSPTEID